MISLSIIQRQCQANGYFLTELLSLITLWLQEIHFKRTTRMIYWFFSFIKNQNINWCFYLFNWTIIFKKYFIVKSLNFYIWFIMYFPWSLTAKSCSNLFEGNMPLMKSCPGPRQSWGAETECGLHLVKSVVELRPCQYISLQGTTIILYLV